VILGVLATLAAGLFAGAAIYINAIEHPARMECGTQLAIAEFRPSYKRAAVLQASLAAVGFVLALATWLTGAGLGWLLGGILLGLVIPFTLLVIRPTNEQLLGEGLDATSPLAAALLARWARLHAVRSGLSLAAFLIFLLLLADRR
jgi:hypothetical protein